MNLKANIFVAVIANVTKPANQLGFTRETVLKMVTTDVSPEESFVPGSNFNTLDQIEYGRIYRVYSFVDFSNPNFYESFAAALNQAGNAILISNDDGAYPSAGPLNNS